MLKKLIVILCFVPSVIGQEISEGKLKAIVEALPSKKSHITLPQETFAPFNTPLTIESQYNGNSGASLPWPLHPFNPIRSIINDTTKDVFIHYSLDDGQHYSTNLPPLFYFFLSQNVDQIVIDMQPNIRHKITIDSSSVNVRSAIPKKKHVHLITEKNQGYRKGIFFDLILDANGNLTIQKAKAKVPLIR